MRVGNCHLFLAPAGSGRDICESEIACYLQWVWEGWDIQSLKSSYTHTISICWPMYMHFARRLVLITCTLCVCATYCVSFFVSQPVKFWFNFGVIMYWQIRIFFLLATQCDFTSKLHNIITLVRYLILNKIIMLMRSD